MDSSALPATELGAPSPLLDVRDLTVEFSTREGVVHALNGVSFAVRRGQVLALLGESGSGKSVTLRAILGLHPRGRTSIGGRVVLDGRTSMPCPNLSRPRCAGPRRR